MIGGMQTCGPSLGGRDQNEPEMKSESVLSRWSWSDDFFKNSEGSYPRSSEVRTHVVVSTATGGVHALTCCTHIFCTQRVHCAHPHIFMRVTHTHGSRSWKRCLLHAHVSTLMIRFFCLCCSFTWHFETNLTDAPVRTILPNFPDPEARVKRTSAPATSSLATWPSPFSTQVISSRSSMRKLPWTMTRRPSTVQTTVSPTSRKSHARAPDNAGFPQCLKPLFCTLLMVILFFKIESKESVQSGNRCKTERE